METIKKVVVGETTEAIVRAIFDQRTIQESSDEKSLNQINRSLVLKDLRTQVLSFIKRNANSKFEIIFPELKLNKTSKVAFTNYDEGDDEEAVSTFRFELSENFDKCHITQKVKVGQDIKLVITAK